MKITCPKKEFFEAVSAAGQAASARTSVNILQTLKIEASGAMVRVVGCDGEMWVERRLASVVEEEGAICVPAKLLVDIANSLRMNGKANPIFARSAAATVYITKINASTTQRKLDVRTLCLVPAIDDMCTILRLMI